MVLSFKYKAIKRDNIVRMSPTIPVTLCGPAATKVDVAALIDSGADLSVIPQDIAELLNLDLSGETLVSKGIGGAVDVKMTTMKVQVNNGIRTVPFFEVPVQVILGDKGKNIPPIMGREGFFNKFKITFDQSLQRVYLKPQSTRK